MSNAFETILFEDDGRIVRITLHRPDKRNALSSKMLEELIVAFRRARDVKEARVVVLRGAGDRAFCAGADLVGIGDAANVLEAHDARALFPELFHEILHHPKVTLAAVNGHCLAGGVGLMLCCDLAIAKAGATMGTPEILRGLFPFMISPLILHTIGRRRALEMMLLGETFSSEEAAALGLVNRTVPSDVFDATVEAWAKKLADLSPAVLGLGRRALVAQAGMPLDGAFTFLRGQLTLNAMLDDAREGISAFFEKRTPDFKGR